MNISDNTDIWLEYNIFFKNIMQFSQELYEIKGSA